MTFKNLIWIIKKSDDSRLRSDKTTDYLIKFN